jgi:hypothetical protein
MGLPAFPPGGFQYPYGEIHLENEEEGILNAPENRSVEGAFR